MGSKLILASVQSHEPTLSCFHEQHPLWVTVDAASWQLLLEHS